MKAKDLQIELERISNPEKAVFHTRFFKTGKGQYGEGDVFRGITVPQLRKVAKTHKELEISETKKLLNSKYHEDRLTALFILVSQFEKTKELSVKENIYHFYLENSHRINNWDLVDISAPKIVGAHLLNKKSERKTLYKLAREKNLWRKRIAILATYTFIKNKDFNDTLAISEILLNDDHDLIHKAVGWMLREIGKIDLKTEEKFLDKHHKIMPRTMLRYAIEKFTDAKRKHYMAK